MVRKVRIVCPHCRLCCELHLSSYAPIIIIACPSCDCSLMRFGGKVYQLSEDEMAVVRREHSRASAMQALRDIVRSREGVRAAMPAAASQAAAACCRPASHPNMGSGLAGHGISHDDVIDLCVELRNCTDAGQFIARLN
jgi:hypothetical protein